MVSSCHMRRVLWRMPNARVLASILKPRETTSDDAHKHTLMQNPFGQKGLLGGNQNNKVPCVVCALVCSALLLCKSFCMQLFGGPQKHLCNMSPVCSTPLHCESSFERNVNSELANFPVKHAFRCEEDALGHPQMLFVAIRGCFFTPWGLKIFEDAQARTFELENSPTEKPRLYGGVFLKQLSKIALKKPACQIWEALVLSFCTCMHVSSPPTTHRIRDAPCGGLKRKPIGGGRATQTQTSHTLHGRWGGPTQRAEHAREGGSSPGNRVCGRACACQPSGGQRQGGESDHGRSLRPGVCDRAGTHQPGKWSS